MISATVNWPCGCVSLMSWPLQVSTLPVWMTVSGLTMPASKCGGDTAKGLNVEPGSKMSVTLRFLAPFGFHCARLFGLKSADSPARALHPFGIEHHHAAFGLVRFRRPCSRCARYYNSRRSTVAAHGLRGARRFSMSSTMRPFPVLDHAPCARGTLPVAPAAQSSMLLSAVFDIGHTDHMRGHFACRVEAPVLALRKHAGHFQRQHAGRLLGRHLAFEPDEVFLPYR